MRRIKVKNVMKSKIKTKYGLKSKIDLFFSLYGSYVLFPLLILLIGNLFFLYVSVPEYFVYTCDTNQYGVYGMYQEPKYSEGVFLYGIRLHDPFYVPQLSVEECAEKQRINDRMFYFSISSIIVMVGSIVYKHRKRIKEVMLND